MGRLPNLDEISILILLSKLYIRIFKWVYIMYIFFCQMCVNRNEPTVYTTYNF